MRQRQISIIILVLAFLISSSGNVIAAAFCPHYLSHRDGLRPAVLPSQPVKQGSSCHEMADMEMGDMQMDDMEMDDDSASETAIVSIPESVPTTVPADIPIERASFELPVGSCGYCWMHSQTPSGSAIADAVNPTRQLVVFDAPTPAHLGIATLSALTTNISPLEHSPPGGSLSRHVLINVFRI